MKKPIIMAVLLTVISTVAFALPGTTELSNTSKFQVVENTGSRYDLYYVSENIDNVIVRILDKAGNLVNTDKLNGVKAFKRTYNLKELPSGNYTLEVKNGEGKASQSIFHNPAKTSSLESIVGLFPNDNKIKVFVAPNDQNQDVSVQIFNDQDQLLFKESISDAQKGFSKVYDLNKVKSNYVTVKLSNGKDNTTLIRNLK
jgi:hypothetical protein